MINKIEMAVIDEKVAFFPVSYDDKGNIADNMYGDKLPENRVDVTDIYSELMAGQAAGKTIMPPDDEHECPWLEGPNREDMQRQARTVEIRGEIKALEASQARPLRELELMTLGVLDETGKPVALDKLRQIETDIEALRVELAALENTVLGH